MSTTYNPYQAPQTELTEARLETDEVELATIPQRIFARVIDNLILSTIAVVLAVVLLLWSCLSLMDSLFWDLR